MTEQSKKEQELIEKIAIRFVCPYSNSPVTPFEIGFVKTLMSFAHTLIREAGYKSPEEVRDGKEQVREAFRFPKLGGK